MSGLTYMECAQSPKKVGDDIAKCTKAWKGMNVTVKLTCQNRQAAVSLVPTASSLVVRTPDMPEIDAFAVVPMHLLAREMY
jgi:ribosomal protein L11